mmetsp:Transcript_68594/g.200695  ORF Transcript_68594/g.200695 Transcript_68594/m.200695 type:complete len:201 (-) Transcript_68594:707-1309(-)
MGAPDSAPTAAPASHIPSKLWTWPHGHTKIQLPFPARKFGKLLPLEDPAAAEAAASAAAASEASLKRTSAAASADSLCRASAAEAASDWMFPAPASPSPVPRTCPKPSLPGFSSSASTKPWNCADELLSAARPLWLQKRWNRMYCALSSPYRAQKLWSCGPQTLCVISWIRVFMRSWYGRNPFRLSVRSRRTIISPAFWL